MYRKEQKSLSNFDIKIDEMGDSGVVCFEGALTEKQANEDSKALDESLAKANYFKLNLEKVTAVDRSCIQLLYSASERLRQSKKQLRIDGICPLVFTSAVEDTGFSNQKWLCFGS